MKNKYLLLLGGNVKNNISWLNKIKKTFIRDYEVKKIYYDHWKNGNEIDFEIELNKLVKVINGVKDYYIIAKSVGSIISLLGVDRKIIKPKKIVILGLPLNYLKKINLNIKPLIASAIHETEILIIQQKNDPVGKYAEVIKEVSESNIKVIEIPGNYHIYGNMECIKPLIDNFFRQI